MLEQNTALSLVKQAMERAYAPYSNYQVGALVVAEDGHSYAGCNVENASYPEGHCAETAAIAAMVLGGGKRIDSVYIMSQDLDGATPCGGCRQRIREFAQADTPIYLCSPQQVVHAVTLGDLLPRAFGPEFLAKDDDTC